MVSPFTGVVGHRLLLALLEAEAASPAQPTSSSARRAWQGHRARRFAGLLLCPGADSGCLRRVVAALTPTCRWWSRTGARLTVDQARATVPGGAGFLSRGSKVVLIEEAGS